jgi:hypothetical protein
MIALDALDHDDGIVDQQADGKHQRQHRQRVDGVAEQVQHPEGAQQHHRHRDRWNERGAKALQEENITTNTSAIASNSVLTTSSMDAVTNGVVS